VKLRTNFAVLMLVMGSLAVVPAIGFAEEKPADPPAAAGAAAQPPAAAAVEEEAPAGPAEVPLDALLKANGDIPDIIVGKPDAKIAIVEYASLSCSHCANFHNKVFPDFKAKYLDTGTAKLIIREFPTSERALVAHMLTRCAAPDKAPALLGELFHKQDEWAFSDGDPTPKLKAFATGVGGMTPEAFETCTKDQKLFDKLVANFTAAGDKFGINATPTFFIDGRRVNDAATMETFDKLLAEKK
jgi:protein-disulfide isomerase